MKKNKRFWLATALVVLMILLFVDFNTYESTQQEQLTKMSLTENEFNINFQKSDNVAKGEIIIKNEIVAEYSIKNMTQPIGISEYQLTEVLPKEFESSLPTIEEIEQELKQICSN